MLDLSKINFAFPQPANTTYFNTSSCGLVSNSGILKAHKFNETLQKYGSKAAEDFIFETIPHIRALVSTFIDAPINEFAFIPNFSYGLSAVIPAIKSLKRVLLFKEDYPSLVQPFLINPFEVFWIESHDGFTIDLEELKQIILLNKIEILAISHVQWLTGFMIDIDELGVFCKQHNVLFILDGTQSLGAIPFSFTNSHVNIFISSNYKWMNGGFGTGILCIKEETMAKYPPKIGGFNSYKYLDNEWKYQQSILSYEPGQLNMSGLAVLQNAIAFKIELGAENIADHNLNLLNRFTLGIASTSHKLVGPFENTNRCNIISFRGDANLVRYLGEQNIVVKMRQNVIRLGIHFYNTERDVDRLISSLKSYDLL